MTKKIKKGYDWAEEQKDKWETIASEKIEQLDEIADSHLDWFNKHSTISEILAWKRSILDTKKKSVPKDASRSDELLKPVVHIRSFDQDSPSITNVDDSDLVNERSQPNTNHKDQGSEQQKDDSTKSMPIIDHDEEVMLCPLPEIIELSNVTDDSLIANDHESVAPSKQLDESNELRQAKENLAVEEVEPEAHDTQLDQSSSTTIATDASVNIAPEIRKSVKSSKISLPKSKKSEPTEPVSEETVPDIISLDDTSEMPMTIVEKTVSPIPPPPIIRHGFHSITRSYMPDKANSTTNMTTTTVSNTNENTTMPDKYNTTNNTTTTTTMNDTNTDTTTPAVVDEHEFPICTPELMTDVESQKITQTAMPATPEAYDDFDMEEDDEVQLVVSNRKQTEEEDEIQLVVSNRNFDDGDVKTSPVKVTTTNTSPIPPVRRNPSIFMSRLFQMGRDARSLKEDSPSPVVFITTRPKASESTSSINTERSNNREMSLLDDKNNKKRPLESTPKSVVSEIEVSDCMPQSPFKKPKAMTQRKSKASIPAPQNEKPESVDNEVESNKKAKDQEDQEDKDDEPKYLIPSWAKSPELSAQLENQAGLDPDNIFGSITPLLIEELFADPHTYLPEIPEQAPAS